MLSGVGVFLLVRACHFVDHEGLNLLPIRADSEHDRHGQFPLSASFDLDLVLPDVLPCSCSTAAKQREDAFDAKVH